VKKPLSPTGHERNKGMEEFLIKLRVLTEWHNPYNITTHNDYTDVYEADSAKEAIRKALASYNFSNPNKSVEILSVKAI
jgi:hypothetical protein